MRLCGSVNIVLSQDNSNQISGSVNIGVPTVNGALPCGSNLLGVVGSVVVKIDIIPDEIKQALIMSGVKFS